jgi:plasmid stability protein
MSVMVQVRNVPTALHKKLKSRAALAGLSLSDYVLQELRKALEHPTRQEFLERLESRTPVLVDPRPADLIRAERDEK